MAFHYCTYFDKQYFFKGLALYQSLARHCPEFTLWILCFDRETRSILSALALPSVRLIDQDEFEAGDHELRRAKAERSLVEYYWTCTPSLPLYVLRQQPSLEGVIYLDADMFFYHDPSSLLEELGDHSVLIHPHRYAPRYADRADTSGIFNVGMIAFRNDDRGLACLTWWRERCNEWCFYRVEDGKLGDQKYLDDWPARFAGVKVSAHPGVGLAPWNVDTFALSVRGGEVFVEGFPLVFYHFHSLRLLGRGMFWLGDYPVTPTQKRLVYRPYLHALSDSIKLVRRVAPQFRAGYSPRNRRSYLGLIRRRRVEVVWPL